MKISSYKRHLAEVDESDNLVHIGEGNGKPESEVVYERLDDMKPTMRVSLGTYICGASTVHTAEGKYHRDTLYICSSLLGTVQTINFTSCNNHHSPVPYHANLTRTFSLPYWSRLWIVEAL